MILSEDKSEINCFAEKKNKNSIIAVINSLFLAIFVLHLTRKYFNKTVISNVSVHIKCSNV